jgi:hypothetical protein
MKKKKKERKEKYKFSRVSSKFQDNKPRQLLFFFKKKT